MPNPPTKRISALDVLAYADLTTADYIPIVDDSELSTKRVTIASIQQKAVDALTTEINDAVTAAEAAQTAAETAQTAAETAQTAAETAETNAEAAEAQAETYASAAATAAKFYDTIANGRAAVADTETFGVVAGGSDGLDHPTLYRRDSSSTQTKITELLGIAYADGRWRALSPMIITRGYTTTTGGVLLAQADYEISEFILVEEGDIITYTGVTASQPNINGYDADGVWVADLNPFAGPSRALRSDVDVTIPSGVALVRASSAFDNSTSPGAPTSPLILKKNGADIGPFDVVRFTPETTKVAIDLPLIHAQALATGSGLNLTASEVYHRTDYIQVIPGERIYYTGVGSSGNARVKGFDENFDWVADLYVVAGTRLLVSDVAIDIPSDVKYIVATSAYLPDASYDYTPLELYRHLDAALTLMATPDTPAQPSTAVTFRSMTYNIYLGGSSSTGRNAVMRHIHRANPDFISIQEAGTVGTIQPLLEDAGFTHFYGPGGSLGLFFASKHEITYSETLTSVDWDRNPLYTEMSIGGNTIGVVSIHLDSSCTGWCHDADWTNVAPQEPAAQRRSIQMYQIMDALNDRLVANPDIVGFIIQGDYNAIYDELNVASHSSSIGETALPSGLSYPLANSQFPYRQFLFHDGPKLLLDVNPAPNGDNFTFWGDPLTPNPLAGAFQHRLDYIAHSESIVKLRSQILNSIVDYATPEAGMPKYGGPLRSDDGYVASDHLPVIADFIIP